jgi:hypothetical protein
MANYAIARGATSMGYHLIKHARKHNGHSVTFHSSGSFDMAIVIASIGRKN